MTEADLPQVGRLLEESYRYSLGGQPIGAMVGARMPLAVLQLGPHDCLVAEAGPGDVVGALLANTRGSMGRIVLMGVRAEYRGQGVGQQMLRSLRDYWHRRGVHLQALEVLPAAEQELRFFTRSGFLPWWTSLGLIKELAGPPSQALAPLRRWEERERTGLEATLFSSVPLEERWRVLGPLASISDRVVPGLDLREDVRITTDQALGDTVLLWERGALTGFAIAMGPDTGLLVGLPASTLRVDLAVVDPLAAGPAEFQALLSACERLAWDLGQRVVYLRFSTRNWSVYEALSSEGYRLILPMVRMKAGHPLEYERPTLLLAE